MSDRAFVAAALLWVLALTPCGPASAQGEILITQSKALAGNVTPGDAAGFPVRLSRTGAYVFASNISPSPGKAGLEIAAPSISLDLNGFELNGGGVATFGIFGGQHNLTLRNGTVTGFKFDGVFGTGAEWIIEDMRVVKNGRDGIAGGGHARVRNNTVSQNDRNGIKCSEGLFEGNLIANN